MFWVLLALLVALPFVLQQGGRLRALAGKQTRALPEAPVGLRARLVGVDRAIDGVRSALSIMTPSAAMASAALALQRAGTDAGPGTQRFVDLVRELDAIDEADLRDLADAGLDPARIVKALATLVQPERWQRELVGALDYWQETVANLRDPAGYR